jgi:hypothetical protein
MRKCIDTPRPAQAVYDECISISGWIFAEAREPSACRVQAWLEGIPIVETRLLFARADVSDFLSLPRDFPMAFRFLTRAIQPNGGVARSHDRSNRLVGWRCRRIFNWEGICPSGVCWPQETAFREGGFPDAKPGAAPRKYLWLWPASAGTRPRDVAPYPRLSLGWKFGPRCRMRGRRLRFWAGCCEKISTASPRPMNCAIIDKPTDV